MNYKSKFNPTGKNWSRRILKDHIALMDHDELAEFAIALAVGISKKGEGKKWTDSAYIFLWEMGVSVSDTKIVHYSDASFSLTLEGGKLKKVDHSFPFKATERYMPVLPYDELEGLIANIQQTNSKYLKSSAPATLEECERGLAAKYPSLAHKLKRPTYQLFIQDLLKRADPSGEGFARQLITLAEPLPNYLYKAEFIDLSKRGDYIKELKALTWGRIIPPRVLAAGLYSIVNINWTLSYINRKVRESPIY